MKHETQLVYDLHLTSGEYVRTFPSLELCYNYVHIRHCIYLEGSEDIDKPEEYEIKTVVRLYWVED